MNKFLRISILSMLCLSVTSCATIMHGTTQSIGISSNPTNADIWVDRHFVGNTPLVVSMSRKDNHLIRLELDGYQPYEMMIQREVSGWVFGNIVFGGFIGLAIDAVTGGIYVLTPDQVNAEMKQNHLITKKSDTSYIAIVMEPDPSWKKIGNLVAAN